MGPEARIERASAAYAKRRGCWALKLLPSITGLPDRLILGPGAVVWFVEFKAPGGRLSTRQVLVTEALRRFGFKVSVMDDARDFKLVLDSLLLSRQNAVSPPRSKK